MCIDESKRMREALSNLETPKPLKWFKFLGGTSYIIVITHISNKLPAKPISSLSCQSVKLCRLYLSRPCHGVSIWSDHVASAHETFPIFSFTLRQRCYWLPLQAISQVEMSPQCSILHVILTYIHRYLIYILADRKRVVVVSGASRYLIYIVNKLTV